MVLYLERLYLRQSLWIHCGIYIYKLLFDVSCPNLFPLFRFTASGCLAEVRSTCRCSGQVCYFSLLAKGIDFCGVTVIKDYATLASSTVLTSCLGTRLTESSADECAGTTSNYIW
jgi:hypothetical protein